MDENNKNSIILSFINDYIALPINKKLEELYKEDYKAYKKFFVAICGKLCEFREDLHMEFGGFFNEY